MNLGKLLGISGARNPRKTAVISGNERISYEQLEESTTLLARWFLQQGCRPGDRIALHWPNSIELVKLFFACFKAGMIAVPINVRMKGPEIAYVLAHSKAVLCFAHPDLAQETKKAGRESMALRAVYSDVNGMGFESENFALPETKDDDAALILYTSGTTARPKGVTQSHRTLQENAKMLCVFAPESLGTMLVMTQMAFASAIYCGFLTGIFTGATVVLTPAFDAPVVLDLIERFQCTYTFALPSMVQFMVEEQGRKPRQVRSLRTVLAGGDSVPVSTQERFQALFGIPLCEGYGMTEMGGGIANPADDIRPGSLGKPLEGVEARVVDANGKDVPDEQSGEIIVRSCSMFVGYWDNPAATKEALRDGWLYSGDLGRRDTEGYFWFEGRKKEIIVRDGVNISPQEVEEAIYDHPAVLEVAVIGTPDPMRARGEQVIAFVALREGLMTNEADLRAHANQRLADFKVPARIVFLKSLPKGITGKVQRRALKEMPAEAA